MRDQAGFLLVLFGLASLALPVVIAVQLAGRPDRQRPSAAESGATSDRGSSAG
jgi:hypothetical protein